MEKLTVLGTGNALALNCYNTCFSLSMGDEHFLVDTGGGNAILSQLDKAGIGIPQISSLFISHNHSDHILGVPWVIRAVAQGMLKNQYTGNFTIYGHKSSIEAVRTICKLVLNGKFLKFLDDRILFHEIRDGSSCSILGRETVFFDLMSDKDLQHGFKTVLANEKNLTFLGDEPYREQLKEHCMDADYLFHEAFCLYGQRDIFKPYEKHHSTAKDACRNAKELNVKNVILSHTEDSNILQRKEMYIAEGREEFQGTIYVPDDLDVILL